MYPNYIPARDADFDAWLENFSTLLTAAPTTYGLIAADATAVDGVFDTWRAAYLAAVSPATRTAATVAAKDAARAAAEFVVRPYAVGISLNADVTPENKTAIGVTLRSGTVSPIPAPVTAPELNIQSAIPLQQTLGYKQPGFAGKNKPFGVTGVEIFRAIGTVPAIDPTQAGYYAQVTKSPFRVNFVADDQGKKVTYFARWATKSGPGGIAQVGPWSAPLTLTIM